MYKISLKNNKSFICDNNSTIFEAAKSNGIFLEHSCLMARCRSCAVRIESGTTKDKLDDLILSDEEKSNKWTLSCNSIPTSDLILDVDDLGDIQLFERKIVPAKIQTIRKLNDSVIFITLRLPPNSNFNYNSGQYVYITHGINKRSYSIANAFELNGVLTFFIKKYEKGIMSEFWFEKARVNDLLRIEGPLGSFFLRKSIVENIIFLATGTGIAPIKAILEDISRSVSQDSNIKYWLFFGARFQEDLLWNPHELNSKLNIKYIPVLSRAFEDWSGERGYVQDIVLKQNIPLSCAQVYACGSNKMIEEAKMLLVKNGLSKKDFFSDAFVVTS